jgi:hypothetical protein
MAMLEAVELELLESFHIYPYPKFRSVKENLVNQVGLRQGVQINE